MRCEEDTGKLEFFMVVFDMESAMAPRPYVAKSATEVLEALRRTSPSDAARVKDIQLIN